MNTPDEMKERTIVSAAALVAGLGSYLYAKAEQKDAMPYLMIGGFIGTLLGEIIAANTIKTKDKTKKCK